MITNTNHAKQIERNLLTDYNVKLHHVYVKERNSFFIYLNGSFFCSARDTHDLLLACKGLKYMTSVTQTT